MTWTFDGGPLGGTTVDDHAVGNIVQWNIRVGDTWHVYEPDQQRQTLVYRGTLKHDNAQFS